MTIDWKFREVVPGDDIQDSLYGEFFADGDNPSVPLVREALQNALDAGANIDRNGDPVRVRISLRRGDRGLSAATAAQWFKGLRPHWEAPRSGLKAIPAPDEACDVLIVEDFGTCGLTGDVSESDVDAGRNNFCDFIRRDGGTRKGDGDRGSWGVGKNVFPRSSRINAYLAYTVRFDDGAGLLVGKSILKTRKVGGSQFKPQCFFAEKWDSSVLPVRDPAHIEEFRKAFGVTRKPDQSGLSIVMPWADPEICFEDLMLAVVADYHYAILAGALSVTIEADGRTVELDRSSIINAISNSEIPKVKSEIPHVNLAAWSLGVTDSNRITIAAPPASPPQRWSPELISPEIRETVNQSLLHGERVAIRVPLHVRKSGSANPQPTWFDVYLEQDEDQRSVLRPRFYRDQLSIGAVKRANGAPKIRSMVVISDEALAELLRKAEPPSHNDWVAQSANIKGEYRDGNAVITFVKSAVSSLMSFIRAGDDKPDASIAIAFFALEEQSQTRSRNTTRGKKAGDKSPEPVTPPPPRLRRYRVEQVDGGFEVSRGDPDAETPRSIDLKMAYDVYSGNPWKQYETADFDLTRKDRSGISIVHDTGAEYKVLAPNRIRLSIRKPDFRVIVTGFDTNRDLIVNARDPKEPIDADPTTELHEETQTHA